MKQQLRFSPITETDLPQIKLLQPEFWGDIIPTFQWYLTLNFCYQTKVELDNEVVGTGVALIHEDSVWLANIIVSRNHRNLGIGSVITEHLIAYAEQLGKDVFLIGTKLGRPIYVRHGFKDDQEYVFFKPHKITLPISQNIIPYDEKYTQAILDLDNEVTGERRLQLLLPRLSEAFVYVKENQFEGFCIPGLGEGLILAKTTEAGLALMTMKLREEKRACLPKANQIAIDFLISQGYEIDETLWGIKMYLHRKPNWKPTMQYGRVGGNMG